MASNFSVNGAALPVEPKSASVSYQDLDGESERNANGVLVRQVIRRNVVKIELEFAPMTSDIASELINMFNSPEFSFTYPDPLTGTTKTITAYCGDRQIGFLRTGVGRSSGSSYGGSTHLYDGLKVSVIEY